MQSPLAFFQKCFGNVTSFCLLFVLFVFRSKCLQTDVLPPALLAFARCRLHTVLRGVISNDLLTFLFTGRNHLLELGSLPSEKENPSKGLEILVCKALAQLAQQVERPV